MGREAEGRRGYGLWVNRGMWKGLGRAEGVTEGRFSGVREKTGGGGRRKRTGWEEEEEQPRGEEEDREVRAGRGELSGSQTASVPQVLQAPE